MFLQNFMHKKLAGTTVFLFISLTMLAQTTAAPAATPEAPGSNLLAILLIVTASLLVFVIWGMGQVLIALSGQLMTKTREDRKMAMLSIVVMLTLLSNNLLAQTTAAKAIAAEIVPNYGGVSPNTFYLLVAVIITEIFAVLFLFFSIKRVMSELLPEKVAAAVKKSSMAGLWTKLDSKFFTKAVPVEHEADALLDHNYDGIQELDNSLPPWWKYGFIITIGFACVYLLNFHVFGNGKNPTQEYAAEMASAQVAKEAYEANNKDKIDESNVAMADATGINNGKGNYMANCVACHGTKGEGGAGPNLTDEYWLHKGSLNAIYNTLKVGYAEKGMQSWAIKFNPKEMSEIASFVKTLKGTNPPNGKAPQGDIYAEDTPGGAASAESLSANKSDSSTVKK